MKKIGLLIVLTFALFTSVVHAEDYVAMVMDVNDKGVQFTGGEPVEIMAFLEENDVVQLKDGGEVVILFFESSMREEVTGPATITIGVSGSVSSAGRTTKIRRQTVDYLPPRAQLDKSHHQNFGNIAFRMLGQDTGSKTQLVITSISNTAYVPDMRPMLTWQVYPKAELFTLTVRGDNGAETSATKSYNLRMTSKPQSPGRYTWVLEAKHKGNVVASREGWYKIMTPERYAEMEKSRDMIQDEYPSGSMQEMAVLSILYQSYEMWDEMALMLLALNQKQPENAEVIRKLRSISPHLLEKTDR